MTLSQAALGPMTLPKQAAVVLLGSLMIAVAAQVSVPVGPVPISLQTLAILLIAFSVGTRLAALTLVAYVAEGMAGLPVFAGFKNAALAFPGATTGFIFGFVAFAAIAGLAAGRGVLAMLGAGLVASVVLYAIGLAWPLGVAAAFGLDVWMAGEGIAAVLGGYMTPYLVGDALKLAIAALLVGGGLRALKRA
ncbi:biotin transporter BioY [Jannaschia sp. Os4]|uniref:biotin transporter BioY n=1 Tax=Jannaschia sp. Os4 TaxID=2807617 RepID=UPI001939F1A7|nr:biotin transporter BioY [Jannaschia sp. Os4]MBM2576702.1 biotin transporter BioY [Jannaschia sp. Os4]